MHLPPTMTTTVLLLVVQSSYALSAKPMKAAIIGGGLGGLTCCNALRKSGVDAHVFERAEKLSPQAGTGLTLWPNGLSAIEAIDSAAIPEILRSGSATVDIEVTSADGLTKLPNPTGDPTRFTTVYGQPMINIRWSKLQQCLAARLPADCIHLGSKLSHPLRLLGITATAASCVAANITATTF